jgi:kynurenine formamidase
MHKSGIKYDKKVRLHEWWLKAKVIIENLGNLLPLREKVYRTMERGEIKGEKFSVTDKLF